MSIVLNSSFPIIHPLKSQGTSTQHNEKQLEVLNLFIDFQIQE
jgi:hypothetical protein